MSVIPVGRYQDRVSRFTGFPAHRSHVRAGGPPFSARASSGPVNTPSICSAVNSLLLGAVHRAAGAEASRVCRASVLVGSCSSGGVWVGKEGLKGLSPAYSSPQSGSSESSRGRRRSSVREGDNKKTASLWSLQPQFHPLDLRLYCRDATGAQHCPVSSAVLSTRAGVSVKTSMLRNSGERMKIWQKLLRSPERFSGCGAPRGEKTPPGRKTRREGERFL